MRFLLRLLLLVCTNSAQANYDPLIVSGSARPYLDITITDTARNRDIPVRIYQPDGNAPHPVILFSHGLGGSRENSVYLAQHWAQRGYVAVFMQHVGSDESLWKGQLEEKGKLAILMDVRKAASAENLRLRLGDVPVVLDRLAEWNAAPDHALFAQLDMAHIGMSGHSFGAVTTQGMSGQSFPTAQTPPTDLRIDAALVMSPSAPRRGDAKTAFANVKIPWLLMTGTKDNARIIDIDVEERLAVYAALPPGNKYQLVLHDGEHMAFSDAPPRGGAVRNPNHHRVILALSTAFFDAYLKGDAAARAWLDGDGPLGVLQEADSWQYK